jgi:hypothetical protein
MPWMTGMFYAKAVSVLGAMNKKTAPIIKRRRIEMVIEFPPKKVAGLLAWIVEIQ